MAKYVELGYLRKANEYAKGVIAGSIPACKWIQLACKRQVGDLQRTDLRWTFDPERAEKICKFAELMPHIRGRWKTSNIILEPWQCFMLSTLFGWVDENGFRRFRKALIVIPRKNAKSTIAAVIGNYCLTCEEEPGSEVYSAATTRDQAKIVWEAARRMAMKCGGFSQRFGIRALTHSISVETTASFFRPLSRDADSMEGLNPHCAIIDELHAHPTREVFDVLNEATGARRQPLLFMISTEGFDSSGVFAEQVSYLQGVLNGDHQDDQLFGMYYGLDPTDDWTSEASWLKANPNLGVSVFMDDMRARFRQTLKNPESQASFLTKRLNIRTGSSESYVNLLAWNTLCKAEMHLEDFYGKLCWMGIDLSSKLDLTAKVLLFRDKGRYCCFGRFYLPEDAIVRGEPNYDRYRAWSEAGLITLTPGGKIDYEFVERDILMDLKNFQVSAIAYDTWNAGYLNTRLEMVGAPMREFPQTVPRLSEPMKELAALVNGGSMQHDGNGALTWMVSNVQVKRDARENVFPSKARPENKIDGAVALIMALGQSMKSIHATNIYEDPATCVI